MRRPRSTSSWSKLKYRLSSSFGVACCALLLSGLGPQAHAADESDLTLAKNLMNTCQAHFGDRRAAASAFRSMETRTVNHNANFRTATGHDGRVMVSSGTVRNWIGCIVVVNGMSRSEATRLANPWIKKIAGEPGKPRNGAQVWLGAFGGKLARVEIGKVRNPVIKGMSISFEVHKRSKPGSMVQK
ncbi:hypothetical protein [Sedimentitalea todarodis]|uniref:Uncharacterized protein n=1 Tax=Sedimentitalea todarodis TaxID=1631240 RepID=A0ABU3VI26_9RHOB|nr:hypothetical protein [Sedimentitalea todarodis]MDU9005837.1 hypothetical protein [Sedimentitalea todarodis]